MSVRVNLLPREAVERVRARRVAQYTAGALVVFVGLLGAGYVLRLGALSDAEQTRDAAQTQVTALEGDLAELSEYRQLADELENRNTLLASAMEPEIAFSRVLNDLSLAFPANASLLTLTVTAADVEGGAAPAADSAIDFGEAIAHAEFSGYSVERFAPGVETVLLDFDRTRAFFNSFLTTAAQAEIGDTEVTNFNGSVTLDEEARTGRYAEGLPPEATP